MLIKMWFSLVSFVLVFALAVLLANFKTNNILHWLSLLVLTITIAMHCIVYLERTKNKHTDLQKTYSEFLKRKDKQIEELQLKNELMFKTAVKKSSSELELAELKRKWEEKMKEENKQ